MVDMTSSGGPITTVREGMIVVDCDDTIVGTVVDMRMSDTGVLTEEGQGGGGSGGLLGAIAGALGKGDAIPEQARARLSRTGYLRVDAEGAFQGDRYVAGDQIAHVAGATVRLSVAANSLPG